MTREYSCFLRLGLAFEAKHLISVLCSQLARTRPDPCSPLRMQNGELAAAPLSGSVRSPTLYRACDGAAGMRFAYQDHDEARAVANPSVWAVEELLLLFLRTPFDIGTLARKRRLLPVTTC